MVFNNKLSSRKLRREWKSSWWVVAFLLFTYMLAIKTSHDKEQKILDLTSQLAMLSAAKTEALLAQQRLSLEIESQTDPRWIEMVLMKKLGLVPQGQSKVRFKKEGVGPSGLEPSFDGL